jgi:hypothetical protein
MPNSVMPITACSKRLAELLLADGKNVVATADKGVREGGDGRSCGVVLIASQPEVIRAALAYR